MFFCNIIYDEVVKGGFLFHIDRNEELILIDKSFNVSLYIHDVQDIELVIRIGRELTLAFLNFFKLIKENKLSEAIDAGKKLKKIIQNLKTYHKKKPENRTE